MDGAHRVGEPVTVRSRLPPKEFQHRRENAARDACYFVRADSCLPAHQTEATMMNRRHALKAFAAAALCPLCPTSGFAADAAHWSYEGTTGPEKWGELDGASKGCSVGSHQAP